VITKITDEKLLAHYLQYTLLLTDPAQLGHKSLNIGVVVETSGWR
jgi:hypothetical protein